MKKAFTLIELLVVVLIIGILSAIALPQYTIAVEKSRVAEALINGKALLEAQELYKLANGNYNGTSFDVLDFEISGCTKNASNDGVCYTKYFIYRVEDGDFVDIYRKKSPTSTTLTDSLYQLWLGSNDYDGSKRCIPYDEELGVKVCKSLQSQGFELEN